jgi:RNA polymerase sigma-70 factor (ECF subfamily)
VSSAAGIPPTRDRSAAFSGYIRARRIATGLSYSGPRERPPGHSVHADSQLADEALVTHSLQGSAEAFGLLVVRHAPSVRAICMARIGSREIDDVVQEVFMRAYQGLRRLSARASFPSYVAQIARNLCVDRLRASRKGAVSLEEIELELEDRSAVEDPREHLLDRLRREVGRLPESQREVLLLFYFRKMSYAHMAVLLGITEAAVNQRLSRARQALRAAFSTSTESHG